MIYAFGDTDKSKVNLGNAADLPYTDDTLINNVKKINAKTEYTDLGSGSDDITIAYTTLEQYNEFSLTAFASNGYYDYEMVTLSMPMSKFLLHLRYSGQNTLTLTMGYDDGLKTRIIVSNVDDNITFTRSTSTLYGNNVLPSYHICAR